MKKILLVGLLGAFSAVMFAAEPNLMKMTIQMEKLWRAGSLMEAMDTATLVLTIDGENRVATDFVHRNWDKMQRWVDAELERLDDESDIDVVAQRCEVYRLLDDIYLNLRTVKMPLYGRNESWVWQPEIGYYSGHYDSERVKGFRLAESKAEQALASFDATEARNYYDIGFHRFLITPGEKNSQKRKVREKVNGRLFGLGQDDKIYHAIFAYELCDLSLWLDSAQTDVRQLQPVLQQHVSDLYEAEANLAAQAGDSIKSYEYRLAAEDWRVVEIKNDDDSAE